MKTLLAILLSFVITEAPVLAIHGGYSLSSAQSVTGDYAGALIPTEDTVLTTGSDSADFGKNALGLFTVSIPTDGLGTGTVYLFSDDQELTGPIQAIADPTNQNGIIGTISATGEVAATSTAAAPGIVFALSFIQITGQAGGGFQAVTSQSSTSQSPTGVNLSGTANVTVQTTGSNGNLTPTDQITFELEGFQQSDVATTGG